MNYTLQPEICPREQLSINLLDRMLDFMIWGSGFPTVPPKPTGPLRGASGTATGYGDKEQEELVSPHCSQPLKV